MQLKLQTVLFFLCLQLFCSLNSLKRSTIPKFCWRDSYIREGPVEKLCPKGSEKVGLFCYKKCPKGMRRFGIDCHSICPDGFRDDGLFCRIPEYGRGAGYPWKFKDGLRNPDRGMFDRCERDNGIGNCEKYGAIVYPKCRVGYHPFGCCICRPEKPNCHAYNLLNGIDLSCAKKVILGERVEKTCLKREEKQYGNCYEKCDKHFTGNGKLCVADIPNGYIQCGLGASIDREFCEDFLRAKSYAVINALLDLGIFTTYNLQRKNDQIYNKIKEIRKDLPALKADLKEINGVNYLESFISKTDSFIEAKRYDDGAIDEILMDASDFLAYIDRMIMKSHNGFMKYGICSRIH